MAAAPKPCAIPDCARPLLAKGLCRIHYERKKRHGDPLKVLVKMSPRGALRAWLLEHAGHTGDECLIWPFARHPDGRAHMGGCYPARIMCELAHGPPPSKQHQAAHSCGKGNSGCVNPIHLRWATPLENAADKIGHGTVIAGDRHYAAKLTPDKVRAIRLLAGTMRQREIGARFGVGLQCVNKILTGRNWRHVT